MEEEQEQVQVVPTPEVQVEVFIPDFQIMPDEIHEDELMDNHREKDAQMEEVPPEEETIIQLGFMEILEPCADPVFVERMNFKNNAEAVRLWSHFFSPVPSAPSVSIPKIWADFFTAMLTNPASFSWAKQFLSSLAWSSIVDHGSDFIPFALLEKCPDVPPACLKDLTPPENLIQIEEIDSEHLSPKVSFGQKKGKKR